MRGYIEKYEVQQPAFQEVTTAFGAVGRFPTGRPQIRLSIVLDAALEDVDDQHFLESIQEGVREVVLDVRGSPIVRPVKNPSPALVGDHPQTAGDTW